MKVLDWVLDHWGVCLFFIGAFVQLVPAIKLNPLEWIGNKINGRVIRRVESLEKSVDDNEKDRIRFEMLDFANTCRNKIRHTKDEFEHIIALKGKYDALLKKTGDCNGVFDEEYKYIIEIYHECQRTNSFL